MENSNDLHGAAAADSGATAGDDDKQKEDTHPSSAVPKASEENTRKESEEAPFKAQQEKEDEDVEMPNAPSNELPKGSTAAKEDESKKNSDIGDGVDNDLKRPSRSFDEEALERRKKRRRLRRMLKDAGEFPSFVALISSCPARDAAEDENDDEDDEDEEANIEYEKKDSGGEIIYIDVDEYLGLPKKEEAKPNHQLSLSAERALRSNRYPDHAASSQVSVASRKGATPAEEGYYEGRVPMAMPEDSEYLTPLQQLIRQNLEIFSATETEVKSPQYGRRTPIVLGKVGIRCIHCAKVALGGNEKDSSGTPGHGATAKRTDSKRIWPQGSISYPMGIASLYLLCSQKPQVHFELCPNIPLDIKTQFRQLSQGKPEGRSRSKEVPASQYYILSAKRIGMVNVQDGVRFGRDLSLDPLPLEAVLAQEKQEAEAVTPLTYSAPEPAPVSSAPASTKHSDPIAQQVIEEAMAEPDDPERFIARKSDKALVSDYIFLCIRQMAICRAVPSDFSTRGKKTKRMRLGFAGFCCRHCQKVKEEIDGDELATAYTVSEFSCRSFSSEADNLASAISNSFAIHLQKCRNVPAKIKSALATFKRIHARHMAQLQYGSQRRLFNLLWSRLRAADVPEDEMMEQIKKYKPSDDSTASLPAVRAHANNNARATETTSNVVATTGSEPSGSRGPDFPVPTNPETSDILKDAEEKWDPSENDGLIQPSDRDLVSDYVFLTMRHLKQAIPNSADFAKARRPPVIAGLCCIHCDDKDPSLLTALARTFPSQPDNYASALNSSLYNHMQNCQFVPANIKRALADLRKIHSGQCQNLAFGAQRRYFNVLYSRLKGVPLPDKPKQAATPSHSSPSAPKGKARGRITRGSENSDDFVLAQFGFFEAPCQSFLCSRCRMIPLPFRARGSLCFARPAIDFMSDHNKACKENGFDLWFVVESLKRLLQGRSQFKVEHITDPLFREIILACFGGDEDLATIFTTEIVKYYQMSRHGGVTNAVENYIKAKSEGLWCNFPSSVDSAKVLRAFERFAETVDGMSPKLHDHRDLVIYLVLISPSLSLPEEDENSSDGDDDHDEEQSDCGDGDEAGNGSSDGGLGGGQPRQKAVHRQPRGKELKRKTDQNANEKEDKDAENMDGEEGHSSDEEAKKAKESTGTQNERGESGS